MGYIFILSAVLCNTVKGYSSKRVSGDLKTVRENIIFNIARNAICCIFAFLFVLLRNAKGLFNITPQEVIICTVSGVAMAEFRYAQVVAHLRRRLDATDLSHVELWQGEAGYPSWAYKGRFLAENGCDDERPQAVFQLRRYFLDIYNGVKCSSFFQMADMWEKRIQRHMR